MLNPRELLVLEIVVIILLSGSVSILQLAAKTKRGCMRSCGKLDIPYPFGINTTDGGSDCFYVSEEVPNQFVIYCNDPRNPDAMPYFDEEQTMPILDISVEQHEMSVRMLVARDCGPSQEETTSSRTWLGTFQLSSNNRYLIQFHIYKKRVLYLWIKWKKRINREKRDDIQNLINFILLHDFKKCRYERVLIIPSNLNLFV